MSNVNDEEICENCRYYFKFAQGPSNADHCRRYPPIIVDPATTGDVNHTVTLWPRMDPEKWCGEFSPYPSLRDGLVDLVRELVQTPAAVDS